MSLDGPILAMDTATTLGSVAVGREGELLAEAVIGVEVRHSEALLPAIAFVLDRAGLVPRDLAAIAAGGGPGSFTGVRIAAATAKGMARALERPLYAFSSLEVLAVSAGLDRGPVCALFDARRGEVYGACYREGPDGRVEEVMAPVALPIGEVIEETRAHAPVFAGPGAVAYADVIREHGGAVATGPTALPRASALLWLAATDPDRGLVARPAAWQPGYARTPGARPMP
jgi:tRNA threonylcarbamoyladenosine biosynthesis protein TsaB